MDYYDDKVGWYDGQISNNRRTIASCNKRIMVFEDDIDDLRRMRIRIENVDSAVVAAAIKSSDKVNKLPSVLSNPLSVLKIGFFSNFLGAIKGSEHNRARNSIGDAIEKVDKKINELQGEIEDLQGEIRRCNGNIDSLTTQKRNYITQSTATDV